MVRHRQLPDRARRDLLARLLAGSALGVLAPFRPLLAAAPAARPPPLVPVPDATTGLSLIRLPYGFRYLSFGWTGDAMADGRPTPDRHDGMAVVASQGSRVSLVRNHERIGDTGAFGPEEAVYDPGATGGTTTLQFDTAGEKLVKDWASLSGTLINCAGGPTPWGSWLSCEECVLGRGARHPAARSALKNLRREHGYVFEVPAEGLSRAVPLKGLGRFRHEAAAVDPVSGIIYLTEDNRPAGFYRYRPQRRQDPGAGGQLEMLRAASGLAALRPGDGIDVDWVGIPEPTRGHDASGDGRGVFAQGRARGATAFSRLEGCWADGSHVVFVSTDGGRAGAGQVWVYAAAEQRLILLYESPGRAVLNHPDNVTVHPHGGLLLCEDGRGSGQRLQWLRSDGTLMRLAENNVELDGQRNGIRGDYRGSEWAGACFSPDGRWLFANIQTPGITLAITGDWDALS